MEIRLLDLFCGGGGCSVGYARAAQKMGHKIRITGVDIQQQNNYPFEFVKGSAMDFLRDNGTWFTHVHASPTCQLFSQSTTQKDRNAGRYPDTLTPVRDYLYKHGYRGVIENVPSSPLRPDIVLNGTMFGLKVVRKRKFETVNWFALRPGSGTIRKKIVVSGDYVSVYGHGSIINRYGNLNKQPGDTVLKKWSYAMGIDWMTTKELSQAIPPAYTEYIGESFFMA